MARVCVCLFVWTEEGVHHWEGVCVCVGGGGANYPKTQAKVRGLKMVTVLAHSVRVCVCV